MIIFDMMKLQRNRQPKKLVNRPFDFSVWKTDCWNHLSTWVWSIRIAALSSSLMEPVGKQLTEICRALLAVCPFDSTGSDNRIQSLRFGRPTPTYQQLNQLFIWCHSRLDFLSFSIAQPDTSSLCLTDRFDFYGAETKTNTICGDNDGQHSNTSL